MLVEIRSTTNTQKGNIPFRVLVVETRVSGIPAVFRVGSAGVQLQVPTQYTCEFELSGKAPVAVQTLYYFIYLQLKMILRISINNPTLGITINKIPAPKLGPGTVYTYVHP